MFVAQVRDGVGRLWWAEIAGPVRPSTVVVPNIFREHYTQMPLIEDQHAVGEFGHELCYFQGRSLAAVLFGRPSKAFHR
jgi:hypothetical protein